MATNAYSPQRSLPPRSDSTGPLDICDARVKYLGRIEVTLEGGDGRRQVQTFLREADGKRDRRYGIAKDLLLTFSHQSASLAARPKAGGVGLTVPSENIHSLVATGQKVAVVSSVDDTQGVAHCFKFSNKRDVAPFVSALEHASAQWQQSQQPPLSPQSARPGSAAGSTTPGSRAAAPYINGRGASRMRMLEQEVLELHRRLEDRSRLLQQEQNVRREAELAAANARREMEELRREVAGVAADMAVEFAQARQNAVDEFQRSVMAELSMVLSAIHAADQRVDMRTQGKGCSPNFWLDVSRLRDGDESNLDQLRQRKPILGQGAASTSSTLLLPAANSADDLGRSTSQRLITFMKRASQMMQMDQERRASRQRASERASSVPGKQNGRDSKPSTAVLFTDQELDAMTADHLRQLVGKLQTQLGDAAAAQTDLEREVAFLRENNAKLLQSLQSNEQAFEAAKAQFQQEKHILADTIAAFNNGLAPSAMSLHANPAGASTANDSQSDGPQDKEFEIVLEKDAGRGLGFSVTGGADDRIEDDDDGVYVTDIVPGGAAARSHNVHVGDCIVSVDGRQLSGLAHMDAVRVLQQSGNTVRLRLRRDLSTDRLNASADHLGTAQSSFENLSATGLMASSFENMASSESINGHSVTTGAAARGMSSSGSQVDAASAVQQVAASEGLQSKYELLDNESFVHIQIRLEDENDGLGFSIAGGVDHPIEPDNHYVYVTTVIDEGAAARDGRLQPFDRIIEVNGKSLMGAKHEDAVMLLQEREDGVDLVVARAPGRTFSFEAEGVEEMVEIQFTRAPGEGLGFSIAGGVDCPIEAGDPGIYVTHIIEGSAAARDGRLFVGDRIVEVNGQDVYEVNHQAAVDALRSATENVNLVIVRFPAEEEIPIELEVGADGLGFSIAGGDGDDDGIYVVALMDDGAAARSGLLRPGDRLIEIDGTSLEHATHEDAVQLLQQAGPRVRLIVGRLNDDEAGGDDVHAQPASLPAEAVAPALQQGERLEVLLERPENGGLGFSVAGGSDDPVEPGDTAIYVSDVGEDSPAHGKLRVGDQLLSANGTELSNVTHEGAVNVLRNLRGQVRFEVLRLDTDGADDEQRMEVTLKRGTQGFGFGITGGKDDPIEAGDFSVYVSHVVPGGVADEDGRLVAGDKLIVVNGNTLINVTHDAVVDMLRNSGDQLQLTIARQFQDDGAAAADAEQNSTA